MKNSLKKISAGFKKVKFNRRKTIEANQNYYSDIFKSGLFSADYYLQKYHDVAYEKVDPIQHYISHGAEELRNPSAHFNAKYYTQKYPDVAASGVNPLLHYIKHGAEELRDPSEDFSAKFYSEVYSDVSESGMSPLRHYIEIGKSEGRWPSYRSAIKESGLFDYAFYLLNNPDVGSSGLSPVDHYIRFGWMEYRNPSASFDLIWYAQAYLHSEWGIDPLFHYLVQGARQGCLTRPRQPVTFPPPTSYGARLDKPRRVCLFAGYDPDGLVDPVVIEYIRDLAHHADVYYLADCHVAPSELAKLDGLTRGAWAERHGRYDFGSWSLLAQKLVGWDIIDDYDELILANDSCYLMRPLEGVFEEMDARDCDWWGLQATKGLASTFRTQGLAEELDLDVLKSDWLSRFEGQATYDFLVGSYFLVLRKPASSDQRVRDLLSHVAEERNKITIIRKYEIGLSRLLISLGYEFETFVRKVYPHQPIYTETGFDLIEQGFPLLKKYHLIENHYKISNLRHWTGKVRKAGVEKCLSSYENNLKRTGDAWKIYKSHDIELFSLAPPLSEMQMAALDKSTPKYDNWWSFPVCSHSHLFNDNIRALFEHVKDDPKIKKIVLTRSKSIDLDGANIEVLPLHSREGQFHLLRSRHVFLKHGVRSNLGVELSPDLHCFHNLWHGIPLKRIGYASLDTQNHLDRVAKENKLLTSVISASKVDRNAMATAYWPLAINDIWVTGLPRHDLIMKPENLLPDDMKSQLGRLRDMLDGRKFILFAPTFRLDQGGGYYAFSDKERDALALLLKSNGYVMGIREHMADRARQYTSRLCGDEFLAVPESLFPCVEVLLREADIVATDYSSTFIDFLLTGRPVISFAYDYDHYINAERGLFYDLEWSFPGIVAKTFDELFSAVTKYMSGMSDAEYSVYDQRRRLFIDHYDDGNSKRVVDRINALDKGDLTIFDLQKKNFSGDLLKNILWVYDRGSEDTARHRIFTIFAEMESMGWGSRVLASDQLSIDHMTQADVVVFCSVSVTDHILDLAEGFRRSGKRVIVDIGDPRFDRHLLEASEYYRARPEHQARMRLQCIHFQKLMDSADLITVPTPALARLVQGKGMDVACIPNSLSSAVIARYPTQNPRPASGEGGVVRVCYLSGSKAHGSDFEVVYAAASRILAERDGVEFHVVGSVASEAEENDRLLEGWLRHPDLSYDAMHDFLDRMDINLAPLSVNIFNGGKTDLKLAEAGLHSVPTIALASEPYAAFIVQGKNGLVARTEDEWHQALLTLITDSRLRKTIGVAARDTTLRRFAAPVVAAQYSKYVLRSDHGIN